eukprot:Pompholyxophrys_punicea_v1_NODE_309_length_2312_cov_3.894993.p1 type:complete len:240 gc:universal NODE_309_length_2312_cov_3.894993:1736-1017(-)
MVLDEASEIYVPVIYGLADCKRDWCYWHFLNFVIVLSDMKFEPKSIGVGFEIGLLKEVAHQFPETTIIGCMFHFKQALRRKMIKIGLDDRQIGLAMQKGSLDLLTVVKKENIETVIGYLRAEFEPNGVDDKWEQFWKYFRAVWLEGVYDFDIWNYSSLLKKNLEIRNVTNGALERFNSKMHTYFFAAHPNIFLFIETIKTISSEYVRLLAEIDAGKATAPKRAAVERIVVPAKLLKLLK